jgi:hypothetical protein
MRSKICKLKDGYLDKHINIILLISKVVKTGPGRPVGPVEPGTGPASGSVGAQNRSAREPGSNRENRDKTGDPAGPTGFEV